MRKGFKTLIVVSTAAVLSLGALSLTACDKSFTPLGGNFSEGTVKSNGGFVVEKGEYVYFVNGIQTYTADNTYGTPVKGALMRVKKGDLAAHKNYAETVIPSLMVSADYTSGIYVYGDRVYYATPTNVKNTSGEVENSYLDFKSAKLDGSDIKSYFRVSDNATTFRYVEENKTVYLAYEDDNELHSYNTASGDDTLLAANVGSYIFHKTDKENPWIYYTMSVSDGMDSDATVSLAYNQIYRVKADATEAPYKYEWDQDYLDENMDGEVPYNNLGEIVLDGIGKLNAEQPPKNLTHGLSEGVVPESPSGYTYTLQSYENDGLYFLRKDLASKDNTTTGQGDSLYYLAEADLTAAWNSVTGNGADKLDVVAQPAKTSKASSSALFYLDGDGHHYIYVSDENIIRADVANNSETVVCSDASGATLLFLDGTSDSTYKYVYFSRSNGAGSSVERAVYNGTGKDYDVLPFEGQDNAGFKPVKVLDVQHASGWYSAEMLDGYLFYADAESIGSVSYSYVSFVDLTVNGKLMNNVQIEALNENYKAITDSSAKKGFLAKVTDELSANASQAMRYFFYMGSEEQKFEDTQVYKNIQDAVALGKKNDFLYSEEEQSAIKAYVEGTGDSAEVKDYRLRSSFITRLGKLDEEEEEAINEYWRTALQLFTEEEEEAEPLPAWAWALIGVAIGLVVVGGGLLTFFLIRRKQKTDKANAPKVERMKVDTTDDRSVDVYADEPTEETTEEVAEEAEEVPAEEEVVEEEPAEEAAEEEPSEETNDQE